jgi:hypothetical protein
MSATIKALLNSARESLSGASTPAPGTPPNATPIEQLFPKVDPAVDGDDCDHDCATCEVKLPKGFKIDEEDKLYGYVKGWSTHVLVATGKTDWVRDVEDEKKSVMEAFGKSSVKPRNGVSMKSTLCRYIWISTWDVSKIRRIYTDNLTASHAVSFQHAHTLRP